MEGFSDGSSTLPASTTSEQASYRLLRLFMLRTKSQSAFILLLLLLSNCDPLLLGSQLVCRPAGGLFYF